MNSQMPPAGDISKYKRDNFLELAVFIGGIGSVIGLSYARNLGLLLVIITIATIIYILWKFTPESEVVSFEEQIIIYKKGVVTRRIDYADVTKFACHKAPRVRNHFKLYTKDIDLSFCQKENMGWDKLADNIIDVLRKKKPDVKVGYNNFYKKLEEW